jgi:hypothetical protein
VHLLEEFEKKKPYSNLESQKPNKGKRSPEMKGLPTS